MDGLAQFKQAQKEGWANFAPLEAVTTPAAARLVHFAAVQPGQSVVDVGCGTGVVAITAARKGATVSAIDLTPQLLERARENAQIAAVGIDFREGDVEQLPFSDGEFDVVLSQFAHIFAPRPEVAIAEMLRVLKPGGTIAFSTWPPQHVVGRTMAVSARFGPAPPPGVASPALWGDTDVVQQRLGAAVRDITFASGFVATPALSPQHFRGMLERTAGPIIKMVQTLEKENPQRLQEFRREFDAIVEEYLSDNVVRQEYLITRAVKC